MMFLHLLTLIVTFGLLRIGVFGAFVLTTLDDADPSITYLPATHWTTSGQCQCVAQPDISQLFAGTWHNGTRQSGDPPVNITLVFNGVGVSVYGVFWDPDADVRADIDLDFTIDDGASSDSFKRNAVNTSPGAFLYAQNMFSISGLAGGQHKLVINLATRSLFLFDRLEVVTFVPDATTTMGVASDGLVAQTSTGLSEARTASLLDGNTLSQTSMELPIPSTDRTVEAPVSGQPNKPIIIGGTFGGAAALCIIVAANLVIRRRRRQHQLQGLITPFTKETYEPPAQRTSSPPPSPKSTILTPLTPWENDLHGFQFLNKESVCTLSDIGVSSQWFATVSNQNVVFTNSEPTSSGTTTSKAIILNIPKRTVYELSYDLKNPNHRTIAHILSPNGGILIRWRRLGLKTTHCVIEAADAITNKFVRQLTSHAKCHISDIRACKWVNDTTVYIPDSRLNTITRWSIAPAEVEPFVIRPVLAISQHQLLRFHVTSDEKWWVANGWTKWARGGGTGLVEIHNVETRESRVMSGVACCIAEVEIYDMKKYMLVVTDLIDDKLFLKIEQLGSDAGQAFEPVRVSVDLLDPTDCPQMVVVLQHLPIIAMTTTKNAVYFFELLTGTYLCSQSMRPDEIWYGTPDGQSILVHQTQKARVCRISVNMEDLIGYVRQVLENDTLASGMAIRTELPGAEHIMANDMYRNSGEFHV